MVELVRFDPPCGRFHEQFRVIIFVRKEGIEGEAHFRSLRCDLFVADLDDLLAETVAHAFATFYVLDNSSSNDGVK